MTRGDLGNFINVITQPNSLFFEIWDGEELSGLIWVLGIENMVDGEVHMVFFDRRPREKRPVVIALMRWVFEHYPFHRLTASVPAIYDAQRRFLRDLGIVHEGVRREAVMSAGKWHDVHLFGILRAEAEALQ